MNIRGSFTLPHYPGTSKSFEYSFQHCSRVHMGGAALMRKAGDNVALCYLVGGKGEWPVGAFGAGVGAGVAEKGQVRGFKKEG